MWREEVLGRGRSAGKDTLTRMRNWVGAVVGKVGTGRFEREERLGGGRIGG